MGPVQSWKGDAVDRRHGDPAESFRWLDSIAFSQDDGIALPRLSTEPMT